MTTEQMQSTNRPLSRVEFARRIDHTLLRATATEADIDRLCAEALKFDFWSVCVAPFWVRMAVERLEGSDVKVSVVVGFPFGFETGSIKLAEAATAIEGGADEVDMVMNIGAFKSGDDETVYNEIESVARFCHAHSKVLKVIIETCYLTDEEKVRAGRIAELAGTHFVKTSTGLGPSGATVEDVKLLRESLLPQTRIKASGGISTLEKALAMLSAGADRIGTSSGAEIMSEWPVTADGRFVGSITVPR